MLSVPEKSAETEQVGRDADGIGVVITCNHHTFITAEPAGLFPPES
jgi:hypothetical protein